MLSFSMLHYRSSEPCRTTALRRAQYAFKGWLDGKEKAYLVIDAIQEIEDSFGKDILPAVDLARKALAEENEDLRLDLMAQALKDIEARAKDRSELSSR